MKKTGQVVVLNKEGLVLAVSRKDNHNDFGLPGGKMEDLDLDDPTNTAIRETFEETGVAISDLTLVFAMHKDGYMGYTYLAQKYSGEIKHDEPHIVKWVPFEVIENGSFGQFNKLVSRSLVDMGVKFQKGINSDEMFEDVKAIIEEHYEGALELSHINKRNDSYEIYFVDEDGDMEETFSEDKDLDKKFDLISKKYGVRIDLSSYYWGK